MLVCVVVCVVVALMCLCVLCVICCVMLHDLFFGVCVFVCVSVR